MDLLRDSFYALKRQAAPGVDGVRWEEYEAGVEGRGRCKISPEQVEGKNADPQSDIFAFGALIYEMISGQRPFQGETAASTMASILKDAPAPPNQLVPAAPRALDRTIRKCLEIRPADRWRSARDLKSALEMIDLDATVVPATSVSVSAGNPIGAICLRDAE